MIPVTNSSQWEVYKWLYGCYHKKYLIANGWRFHLINNDHVIQNSLDLNLLQTSLYIKYLPWFSGNTEASILENLLEELTVRNNTAWFCIWSTMNLTGFWVALASASSSRSCLMFPSSVFSFSCEVESWSFHNNPLAHSCWRCSIWD